MMDSSILHNEKVAALSFGGRCLLTGLIMLADDQGRCKANPAYLRSQIFAYDDVKLEEMQVWLNHLVLNETIILYESAGKSYLQFHNWWNYQLLTFARPSDYPPPDGWQDRIFMNGKANIPLCYNWYRADGSKMDDTCDATGKPLPFVAELIAARKETKADKVPTQVPTQVPTLEGTRDPTQVNQDQDHNQDQPNRNKKETKHSYVRAFCREWLLDGWMNGEAFLDSLNEKELLTAAEWLWLHGNLQQTSAYQINDFALLYPRDPFAGVDNAIGLIISKVRGGTAAPLVPKHREQLAAELCEEVVP